MINKLGWMVASALMATGCAGSAGEDPASNASAEVVAEPGGAVYVDSNESSGNRVLVFNRAADGSLTSAGAVSTGGMGIDAALGSQGAIVLDSSHRWLFAVNAGSNNVSTFEVTRTGLRLVGVTPSEGTQPISVTIHDNIVYVLNAGGTPNIAGFVTYNGALTPIRGSVQSLGGTAADGPAEVQFSADGSFLAVTEKGSNQIDSFDVDARGAAGAVRRAASNGQTPYGFAFTRNNVMVVSEAFGGAAGAGAVSSYTFDRRLAPSVVSGSVANHQGAPCWVALSNDNRYAWIANTASTSVSTYEVRGDGTLTLLDNGVTVMTGPGTSPTDEATDPQGRWLYLREGMAGSVAWFAVDAHGGLSGTSTVGGLTPFAAGIAVR